MTLLPYLNLVCIYRGILIHVVSHLHSPILLKFVRMGGIQKRKFSIWAEIILPFIWNQSACLLVFSIWVFFHEHSRFTGHQGKGEGIYLTPLYHFHPLHRHLDISRAITAESSPLHIDCTCLHGLKVPSHS